MKQRISKDIQPLKEMLSDRYDPSRKQAWLNFIKTTKNSILQNPDQYIDIEKLPAPETLSLLVNEIFDEYITWYTSQ